MLVTILEINFLSKKKQYMRIKNSLHKQSENTIMYSNSRLYGIVKFVEMSI